MSDNHLLADLGDSIDALAPALLALQRDIHAHPELSRGEVRTTARVEGLLRTAGVATRSLAVSGLVADLGAEQPAYRVALRADLDALPVGERTGVPWASLTEGICHACGHDVHVAAVLGAGLALNNELNAFTFAAVGNGGKAGAPKLGPAWFGVSSTKSLPLME